MTKKLLKSIEKLKHIEDQAFRMGNTAAQGFELTSDIYSLRGAVMAYRCSMQSIRDQARYKVSIKKK